MKYFNNFRPTFWSSVFTLIGFVFLVALGTWQVNRLEWKNNLIEERQSFLKDNPIEFNGDINLLEGNLWKPVRVFGSFSHEKELYLAARSMRGNVGFHVLTPFTLLNGKNVLINRGWVPRERKDPSQRSEGSVFGNLNLVGIITPGFKKGPFTPKNDAEKNVWLYVDFQEMGKNVGLSLESYVIDATENGKGGFPIGSQTRIKLPNDHLQYAITWYLLSISLVVIWFFWNKKNND